jgi:hypothetical protein
MLKVYDGDMGAADAMSLGADTAKLRHVEEAANPAREGHPGVTVFTVWQ